MLFYRHVDKWKTDSNVNKLKLGLGRNRGKKPRKTTVGPVEAFTVFLRLTLATTVVTALLLSPFLLWEFVWYGVIPALGGHGDAGMYREGREIANGDGIRVVALILLAVPPFTVAYVLPGALDRMMRARMGVESADNVGPAEGGGDAPADIGPRGGLGGDLVQFSPDGEVTPYGIPEQGFSWDDK